MVFVTSSGDFRRSENFLKRLLKLDIRKNLERYGHVGVAALSSATPVESGLAAGSWYHKVQMDRGGATLSWHNRDVESGFPVAIMLQYGYGTGTGGYVQGRDYINPAIQPVFDKIADDVWREVTAL